MTRDGSAPCTHASADMLATDFTCVLLNFSSIFSMLFFAYAICTLQTIGEHMQTTFAKTQCVAHTNSIYTYTHTHTLAPCIRKYHRNNVDTQIFNQTNANMFGLFRFFGHIVFTCAFPPTREHSTSYQCLIKRMTMVSVQFSLQTIGKCVPSMFFCVLKIAFRLLLPAKHCHIHTQIQIKTCAPEKAHTIINTIAIAIIIINKNRGIA